MKTASVALIMLILFFSVLFAQPHDQAQVHSDLVEVIKIEGDVRYRPTPKDTWQSVAEGQKLGILAQIVTGEKSSTELSLENGVIRLIAENEMISIYQIVADGKSIKDLSWAKNVWSQVCRVLEKKKELLAKVDLVTGTKGSYRVDWSSYNFASLYWKDDQSKPQYPTLFHIQSAIAAMGKMIGSAVANDDKAELNYLIAECELMVGNEAKALEYFRKIEKNFPDTPWSKKASQRLDDQTKP